MRSSCSSFRTPSLLPQKRPWHNPESWPNKTLHRTFCRSSFSVTSRVLGRQKAGELGVVSHLMRIRLIFILTVFLLHACGVPQSPAQFDKTPEAQYLKATVDRLVARDFMSIESQMDERVHQADARQALERLASVVPAGPPLKLDPVAWNFFKSTSSANGGVNSRS